MRYTITIKDSKNGSVETVETDQMLMSYPSEDAGGTFARIFGTGNDLSLARIANATLGVLAHSLEEHPSAVLVLEILRRIENKNTVIDFAAIEKLKEGLK